ncbi:MAG TPA: 50S ribosomal protein L35ae [Candidatus Woesearchaeota archaeon]|nr:50S ribosomal protein L35ae [Candidatus Woesearchaeota archaeon]
MKAVIMSYRRSRHKQYPDQILIKIDGVGYKTAPKYLGKKVIVNLPKLVKMTGKVIALHGKNGVVRARFSKGLPGQVLGKACEVKE